MRTVQRRLKGQQEAKNTRRSANKDAESRAHREAKVTSGRAAQFRGSATAPPGGGSGQGGLYIYGLIKVSQDIRERGITPGSKIPAGQLDRVINALVQGGPDAAAQELNSLISQHYVAGMSVERLDEIDY